MATEGGDKKVELLDLIKDGWFEETQSFWSGMCPSSACLVTPPSFSPFPSVLILTNPK
jgi:hypothetical protein